MTSDYRRFTRQLRSQDLTRTLQRRLDVQVRQTVERLVGKHEFTDPIETFLISQGAWEHVQSLNLDPVSVFCHPDMLVDEPFVSLYYRGVSGLSLKEVQSQARAVINWEREPSSTSRKPQVSVGAARQVSGLYNSFISSIIENTADWTLENGYRMIIASIGISFDGSMRNVMGRLPEFRIRRILLQHAIENQILTSDEYPDVDSVPSAPPNGRHTLADSIVMIFASEPDVAFHRDGSLEATIEIKGGIDPAGALERLGAANKSASSALTSNPRCKNFLVAGVITAEMQNRLAQERLFERYFGLVELLSDTGAQTEFFDEIFNYALRLTNIPSQR
jgi:hypothetical protein